MRTTIDYTDAPCVAVYREIREGVSDDATQIGYGYNRYPASPALARYLHQVIRCAHAQGRFAEYGTTADARERALFAELLSRHQAIDVDDQAVVFTNGATEAVNLVTSYLTLCGALIWLPLPSYYAFEQSIRRWGGVLAGHYRHDGTTCSTPAHAPPRTAGSAVVDIIPNGVTGSIFVPPHAAADFTVIDVVFHIGRYRPGDPAVAAAVRGRLVNDLAGMALLMTPAKDLSVPGLRAGALITGERRLVEHARREQFSQYASLNPMISQLMLTYLTMLVVAESGPIGSRGARTAYRWICARYAAHRVEPMPSWQTCEAIRAHLTDMATHFAVNLRMVEREAADLLTVDDSLRPVAGYSAFPRLQFPAIAPADLVTWVNTCGRRHHLKLNPAVMFGGDTDSWTALYPEPRIRVNVSVPTGRLRADLARLRRAWPTPAVTAAGGDPPVASHLDGG